MLILEVYIDGIDREMLGGVILNSCWNQFQYYHQIKPKFVTYKTNISNNDGDCDSDSNSSNMGNNIKKIHTQDKLGMLVYHRITTT